MNLKKAFQAFNEALKEEEITMGEGVLADGTIIKWEGELAEGVAVLKITEDGETSLEDGQFTLEDGTLIEVKGGLIATIVPVEEEMESEFDSEKFKNEISEMIDSKIAEAIGGLEFAKGSDVTKVSEELSTQVEAMSAAMMEAFEKVSEPKPTKPTNEPVKNNRVERAMAMARALRDKK